MATASMLAVHYMEKQKQTMNEREEKIKINRT